MQGLTTGWLARRNAWKWPDEEAVVQAGQDGRAAALSHAEFDERTDRVAHGLGDLGLDAGDTVGIYMQNGVEVLELYVGAMKAGVLPVPLNHRFQGQEVAYVLQDSGVDALAFDILAKHTIGGLHEDGAIPADAVLYVGDDPPEYATAYETFRERAHDGQFDIVPTRLDDAILLYTSGTTGDPKGCYLTHDNLLSQIETLAFSRQSWEDREDRTVLVLPLFHVGAVARYVADAYDGDTTVLMQHFQPELVMEMIESERVTQGAFVPTMARMLLDVEDFDAYDVGSLEEFAIGAAPADRELKETIVDRFDCDLREVFGQTELSPTTVMLSPDDVLEKPDAVGRPLQNVLVRVEDPETGEPVDVGEIGRICYKGPTVFRRYHDLPEKNDAVFEDGWFKSGDLVRIDEDGFAHFAGREDDMIVSGGENIYPAEVEEVLVGHPDVARAAVVGAPDDEWGERVKAAVVVADGSDLSEPAVIDYVNDRIAGFKAPREVQFLESLPKGPTGKVEKSELVPE
jgi:acyl-CoA synthetase (AMP-forming)/AMP-acid ligase II